MVAVLLVSTVAAAWYSFRLVRWLRTPRALRRRDSTPYSGDPRSDTPSLWSVAIDVVGSLTGGR